MFMLLDKKDLLQRESMGVITEDMQSVFKEKYITKLYDKQRYKLQKTPLFIFISVDPNGGGDSEMGIITMCVEYNSIVILAMDTHCAKGHEAINRLLTAHIDALRSKEELADAWIIAFFESNRKYPPFYIT